VVCAVTDVAAFDVDGPSGFTDAQPANATTAAATNPSAAPRGARG
jgi:hypothetical protein